MNVNYKELRSLLRADILDHPEKLSKLAHCIEHSESYYRWTGRAIDRFYYALDSYSDAENPDDSDESDPPSNSPVLDALVESNMVRMLTIPRGDALSVIGALVKAYYSHYSLICEVLDMDRLAKALYDTLHIQTSEGLVEDLTEKRAVYGILHPLTLSANGDMEDSMIEAFTRHGLIEAFEIGSQARDLFDPGKRHYHKSITRDQERLVFDECKARYDRAHNGLCSLDAVRSFFFHTWTSTTLRNLKELAEFSLESHPLIVAEVAFGILRYHRDKLDDIFSMWPNSLEQVVDAILEWPCADNLNYWASLEFIRHCQKEPVYAKRLSDMGSTKAIALMNLIKAMSCLHWNHFGAPLILTMVKYTPDIHFRVQLIIYPWHEIINFKKEFLAECILAGLSETENFKDCPKYILLVAAHLLKAFLRSMEQNVGTSEWAVITEKKCAPYYDKARAALKIYEDIGAFEHDFAQEFPDICEPGTLKSFMLENCEEFAKDYAFCES